MFLSGEGDEGCRRTSLPALQSLEVAGNAGECFCPRWGALAPCCWMVGGTPADAPANAVVTGRPPLMPLGLGPSGLSPPACCRFPRGVQCSRCCSLSVTGQGPATSLGDGATSATPCLGIGKVGDCATCFFQGQAPESITMIFALCLCSLICHGSQCCLPSDVQKANCPSSERQCSGHLLESLCTCAAIF